MCIKNLQHLISSVFDCNLQNREGILVCNQWRLSVSCQATCTTSICSKQGVPPESGGKFKCPPNAPAEWLTEGGGGGGGGGGCVCGCVSLAQRSTVKRGQLKVAELCLRARRNAVFSRPSSLCKHIKAKQRKWRGPCIAPDKRKFLLSRFASKGLRKMSLFPPFWISRWTQPSPFFRSCRCFCLGSLLCRCLLSPSRHLKPSAFYFVYSPELEALERVKEVSGIVQKWNWTLWCFITKIKCFWSHESATCATEVVTDPL